MSGQCLLSTAQFAALLAEARPQLVRLCTQLTGSQEAAEDLAQETLLIAWRRADQLYDPAGYRAWLAAIARNLCRRWLRRWQLERGRSQPLPASEPGSGDLTAELPDTDVDLEAELERAELATLLDRALALLPAETRELLLRRYLEESSVGALAAELGLSEGAVQMRLQRGKLALKRVLEDQLQAEAASYSLVTPAQRWEELRRWCPHCGRRRLAVYYNAADGRLWLRCPDCAADAGPFFLTTGSLEPGSFKSYWPALTRAMADIPRQRDYLTRGAMPCARCGQPAQLWVSEDSQPAGLPYNGPDWARPPDGKRVVLSYCSTCASAGWAYSTELALYLPEGLAFWRTHERIRTLPERELQSEGRDALWVRFEQLDGQAHLDIVYDRHTYEVLHVDQVD